MKHTCCPSLWNEVFIDAWGDVYACCRLKPSALGNIHRLPLDAIWNSRALLSWRKKSRSGNLRCFERCTLIILNQRQRPPRPGFWGKARDYPKKLVISFGTICNLRCIMCRDGGKKGPLLDPDLVLEQVNLQRIESIEIQGGEPLAIEGARYFFDRAAALGKKVSLLTNGTLIDDSWAHKIAAHSSFVQISLNAATSTTHERVNRGSSWRRVLENIALIRRARETAGGSVKIIGHMTIAPENIDEVPLFAERFSSLGLDAVSFGYDRRLPLYLCFHPSKKKALAQRLKTVSNNHRSVHGHRLKLLGLKG